MFCKDLRRQVALGLDQCHKCASVASGLLPGFVLIETEAGHGLGWLADHNLVPTLGWLGEWDGSLG